MSDMNRREFLASMSAAALTLGSGLSLSSAALGQIAKPTVGPGGGSALPLQAFDYSGVRLLPSFWQQQYQTIRDFYLAVPNDDILHGYRARAGVAAPGTALGGWAAPTTGGIFGQWLSGMSQMYRATGDTAMRDKAVYLFTEWAKTLPADGDAGASHYTWDKTVCGLVDLARYADHKEALPVLERVVDTGSERLSRENHLFDKLNNRGYMGVPGEWYTLSENLYRAYQLTGDTKYRDFAKVWHYTEFWNKFAKTDRPPDAHGSHAYSHVNTFSSACAAHEVTGDPAFLTIAKNAYDYLQKTQCFASGGWGPNERLMAPDGSLGRALDTRSDTTEIGCGSWAGFKLSRHLIQATGEARYGDWAERLLYNGVGAMLPLRGRGENFYYADYRIGGGMKVYNWDTFTCCSGTLIQNVATYHDLIYFKDAAGLYVNLFVPSEVTWESPHGQVKLTQETQYPDAETTMLKLALGAPAEFPLHFRVPEWTSAVAVRVNGEPLAVDSKPGAWGTIRRTWKDGDRIELRIPLPLRMTAVDEQHPDRVAVMRGPVMLALEGAYHDPNFRLPLHDGDLEKWLVAEDWSPATAYRMPTEESTIPRPHIFRVAPPDGSPVRLRFRPFYDIGERYPYFTYFDRKELPYKLW